MSFLGFGKKTPEEVSKKIAEFANSIKIKAQNVIECEAKSSDDHPLTHKDQEECLDNLDQIEHMVKDATKEAKDRLKNSSV